MRIVKLSSLSEEERKRVLEEQEKRYQQNQEERKKLQEEAHQKFVDKFGEGDTNPSHTFRHIDVINAMETQKEKDEYRKANHLTLWDTIQDMANSGSYIAKKTGAGAVQGTAGIAQGVLTDTANNLEQGSKMDEKQTVYNAIRSIVGYNPVFRVIDLVNQLNAPKEEQPKNISESLIEGVSRIKDMSPVYSSVKSAQKITGKLLPNAGKNVLDLNNKISEPINKMNEELEKESKNYGEVTNFLGNVGQVVGNMAPSIAGSAITKDPTVGLTLMGLSTKGQSTQEALKKGADLEQAVKIGDTKAMIEVGTEMLTGGVNIFGKGALDDIVERGILDKVKGNVAKIIAKQGLNIGGEVLEETISDVLGTVIDKGTVDPNATYSIENWKDTALTTMLTTLILNSFGIAGDIKDIQNKNADANYWMNQAQNIINQNNTEQQATTQKEQQKQDNKVIEQENKIAQNGLLQEQNKQIVANNQEMMYNSSNESESDVNEGNIEGHIAERGNRLYEESTKKQREFTWDEYNKWEKSIKPIKENNLTFEERQSINKAKQEYNKEVYLFDENSNDKTYAGGASQTTPNKINISKQQAEYFGLNNMIEHENVESDIMHNDIANDILTPAYELIKEDPAFEEQKIEFWKEQEEDMPKDDLIAKDILCDRFAEIKNKTKMKYENILSNSTNSTIDSALQNYYKQVYGKELEIPSSFNLQQENTKGEAINWAEIERPEENKKFRKHYKSIIESDNTTAEAKKIAKDLMKTDTYVPETNKGQLAQADERIMNSSPETELKSLISRTVNNEKISSVDIAVGERLIQYFSKTGDAVNLQEAIQATALAGTSAGQTVQALSMLNHQTPQGQVTWLQRSVDKMNKELAKKKGGTIQKDADGNIKVVNKQGEDITNKVNLFNLTSEMTQQIMNSENQEQMWKNIDKVYEELGQQVPKSMLEKIDSWRYFSMLANARTHIRNMVGNLAMGKTQKFKDKLAGGIEDVVSKFNPEMERTKTLKFADKKTKEFAKNDFKNADVQSRLELNENKYNPQSRLQNSRRTFKTDALENTLGRLFNLNDKLLEAEDGIGLKAGYQKALADYITANKIDVDNITDKQLNKARNYAIQQAKEATFHQANALASWVSQLQSNSWQSPKGKGVKLFVDAVLPFKKTPMNVAKAGVEYSPVGLLKSVVFDTVKLRKGDISINQYIDNISKGMTGTGIALTGYALAKAGILKASGGDDKDKEKYDEEQGKQSYSIEIAGKTYSLDWLAPTGIPLFIGAEAYNIFNQEHEEKSTEKSSEDDRLKQAIKSASNLANAGATAINPMSEMSMISGLTSALSSYNTQDGLGNLGNIMTNAGKSYINQFVPTLLGQVAKTTDEYERTTKSTATGTLEKAIDQTKNQIKSKIPGLRQTLPIKTDIWGNDVKQEVNLPLRAINNFVNPSTVKEVSTDKVDKELNKLYEVNSNSSILPDILQKKLTLNGTDYRWTNEEYAEFTKKYGQTSHKLIEDFINSKDYNKLTQEQKETAISNIYSYAKEKNKIDYAKKVNKEIEPSTLYTTMNTIEKNGGKQSEYLNYLAKTKGMTKESEKNKVLADSNYSNKTKEAIYTNGTGKDDNLYNGLLSKSNINITEYLKYKYNDAQGYFKSDRDSNGKEIKGQQKKDKVIRYLNENITGVGNRLLIAGKEYALQNSEKQKLADYINQITSSKEERLEMYSQLDKNFLVKDGKVYIKTS